MNKGRILPIAVTLFLLLWGVGATVGAGVCLCQWSIRTYRVFAWPKTTGVVKESEIGTVLNRRGAELYCNRLSVEYVVGGVTNRTGLLYPFGGGFSSTKFMHEDRKVAFPVGATTTVCYNPTNSAEAAVGYIGWGEVLWGLIPLILMPVGIAVLFFAFRFARCAIKHNLL